MFNNINDGVNILKKLVKAVSNNVEKKRINNVIKAVNVILKHFSDQDVVSELDSFDDESDSDFSSVEEKGL